MRLICIIFTEREFEKKYIEYEQMNIRTAKKIKATDLWRKSLTMLYETGQPMDYF